MHVLMMHAAHVASHPGFKIFGQWQAPELLGQILHWFARLAKILMIGLTAFFMLTRGFTSTTFWRFAQMLFLVVIGLIGIPSIAPKVQHWTASITKGGAVGSTGASVGILAILGAILALTFYSTILRRPAESGEE